MPRIGIQICRFVDEHEPGFVECMLSDAFGKRHIFVQKAPIVSIENLGLTSSHPRPGVIACEVIAAWADEGGRALSRINTERPWGVESISGLTEFVVLSSELASDDVGKTSANW